MYNKFKISMLLTIMLTMTGCKSCLEGHFVKVEKTSAPIQWFLAVDTTPTVKPTEFAEYPTIAAETVLACLRPRDRVYQLLINSDAERKVEPFNVARGKVGVAEDAKRIYQSLKTIERDSSKNITTNLASVLSYVKKVINEARKERQQLQERGKSLPPETQYVVVLLTDGLPDGQQTIEAGEFPSDVQVWAFGVKRENVDKFQRLCLEKMHIPAGNLHIKQFSAWQAGVSDFAPAIGRTRNTTLMEQLTTGQKAAAGI